MCERSKSRFMEGCDQEARGDAHGFRHVVMTEPAAIGANAVFSRKDCDQRRRIFEKRFVWVRAKRR
jgi:hypothetical protein